jgi:uncharacterized protein (DUF433 family)
MPDLYGGNDPRSLPTYTIIETARYLRIPARTIRSWVTHNNQHSQPLIPNPDRKPHLLSFNHLIEIHLLRAIRKAHKIQLDKVRLTLDHLESQLKVTHPLTHNQFRTAAADLFAEHYSKRINASKSSQTSIKDSLNAHLDRIDPDDNGLATKLYPFTRSQEANSPRIVVIDSRIAFGRLIIVGTGIPTQIIAERYQAGDSIDDLADDYNCPHDTIEEAIRCEMQLLAV